MEARGIADIQARAEKFLAQGEPLLAYDLIIEGLAQSPDNLRFRQLQGLALARSGATARANAILEKLRHENQADEETLGMLGRTFKDLATFAQNKKERENFLRSGADIYGEAYQKTGGYWSGINAATLNLLVGQTEVANDLAQRVHAQCVNAVEKRGDDIYWELAALGEAALILHDLKSAGIWYSRAATEAKRRFGNLQSSRRNARLILQHWKEDLSWIDDYLRIPKVVVFAGHMIDRPDRKTPRFPAELETGIANEIRKKLDQLEPGVGFSSAACGSDILFLEAMLDRGAEITIVLPYEKKQFVRDSVDFAPRSNWRSRFDRVLEKAMRVVVASPQKLEVGGVSYEFCNDLLLGLASIRATQLETKLIPLAVWDGLPGDGPGGAASAIEKWRSANYNPEIVDLGKISGLTRSASSSPKISGKSSAASSTFGSRIVAILFADAVGFSKLGEAEVPQFVQHFLGAIAKLGEEFEDSILTKNTWGDGLYFAFADVDAAGRFALQLADLVARTDWEAKNLPRDIGLRIGLHAGPAYEFRDPVTRNKNYGGTHVSRAARIEPITPRNQVYASESFAALAAARRTESFVCDYVGQTPMAKGYGTFPTYHVRPRSRS